METISVDLNKAASAVHNECGDPAGGVRGARNNQFSNQPDDRH